MINEAYRLATFLEGFSITISAYTRRVEGGRREGGREGGGGRRREGGREGGREFVSGAW